MRACTTSTIHRLNTVWNPGSVVRGQTAVRVHARASSCLLLKYFCSGGMVLRRRACAKGFFPERTEFFPERLQPVLASSCANCLSTIKQHRHLIAQPSEQPMSTVKGTARYEGTRNSYRRRMFLVWRYCVGSFGSSVAAIGGCVNVMLLSFSMVMRGKRDTGRLGSRA